MLIRRRAEVAAKCGDEDVGTGLGARVRRKRTRGRSCREGAGDTLDDDISALEGGDKESFSLV